MTMHEVDLIITAERIDTGEGGPGGITAIAVRDGRIVALGATEDAAVWVTRDPADHHHFAGATVCAGLSDAHSHPVHGLLGARGVDLGAVRDEGQLVERLAAEAERKGPGQWIIGWNLNPDAFEGEPGLRALDSGSPDNPVFIRLFDFHAGVANTRALRVAGVSGSEDLPGGAEVVLDSTGAPTGYLKEFAAMRLVEDAAPAQSDRERAEALLLLLRDMAASGLTATHSLTYDSSCAVALDLVEADGNLPLRVRLSPVLREEPDEDDYSLEEIIALQGTGGRDWGVEGVKFFLDGTIDNGTAWLREPDAFGESTRSVWSDPEQYSHALRRLHEAGVATATHAIGDAAVQHAVQAIGALDCGPGTPRHRIEHIETLDDDLVRMFAASGTIASMQPAHAVMSVGEHGSSTFVRRLADRADQAFRVRSLLDAGAPVAFGSDWPIGPFDPRVIMAMARTRRTPGVEGPAVGPNEVVTARQALAAYTESVATIHGAEGSEGVIAVGAFADFTVFAADPLAVEPEELTVTDVLATFVRGRRV